MEVKSQQKKIQIGYINTIHIGILKFTHKSISTKLGAYSMIQITQAR